MADSEHISSLDRKGALSSFGIEAGGFDDIEIAKMIPLGEEVGYPHHWGDLASELYPVSEEARAARIATHFIDVGVVLRPFEGGSEYRMGLIPSIVSKVENIDYLLKKRAKKVFEPLIENGVTNESHKSLAVMREAAKEDGVSLDQLAYDAIVRLAKYNIPLGLLLHWEPFFSEDPGLVTLTYHPEIGIVRTANQFIWGLNKLTTENHSTEVVRAMYSLNAIVQTESVKDGEATYTGDPKPNISDVEIIQLLGD